ncbi:sigma-70 family RNA polymerase sigma factor [Stigmatella erecta]|uniref:RNA polymerase sigma-70 factor, ECF subfamily n=1 Tax=Stigmatella erecta TaxID=83460 RepID=A0A1I0HTX3_9BACT|nr:sigma-70 family RNA polymerase sigma factor [Stigmatella erecta]SET86690.1 RNA polymerase sigma-70 factor, ECF subfamily [Stigmatella erecta]
MLACASSMAPASDSPPEQCLSPEKLHAKALGLLPKQAARALAANPRFGAQLHAHFEASARARATFEVPEEDFLRALVRHVPPAGEDLAALQAVHAEELALALGCAVGHPVALAEFDQRFGASLRAALKRVDPSPAFLDEALQAVRERLFLRQERSAPKIATYAGTGSLSAWVRTVALRVALNLRLRATPEVPMDERLASGLSAQEPGPELALLKSQYREAFQQSFRAALGTLSAQETNVLRLHFVSGLSLDRLGEMYQVHRATIARWVARAREQLLHATQRELQARLTVDAHELHQILELVRSQLAITLTRALH